MSEAGIYDLAAVTGTSMNLAGACPYCSSPHTATFHSGACPRLKAIEYHPNGTVKRVELNPPEPARA